MEKRIENISAIAFYFFVVLGFLHISASILVSQGITGKFVFILFQTLDLPFLAAALVYGTTQFSLRARDISGGLKLPLIICGAVSILLFLLALYFNFAIPDAAIR